MLRSFTIPSGSILSTTIKAIKILFLLSSCSVNTDTGSQASQTLQMAPLLPAGQSWADLQWYQQNGITPEGVQYPGSISFLRTEGNPWTGTYGRPGNPYQDSMSAISYLNDTFYEGFHTFGVDWEPGEYIRWYIDGLFAYEVNPNSLTERWGIMNGTSECGDCTESSTVAIASIVCARPCTALSPTSLETPFSSLLCAQ